MGMSKEKLVAIRLMGKYPLDEIRKMRLSQRAHVEDIREDEGVCDVICGRCHAVKLDVSLVSFEVNGEIGEEQGMLYVRCIGCGILSSYPTWDPRNIGGFELGQAVLEVRQAGVAE